MEGISGHRKDGAGKRVSGDPGVMSWASQRLGVWGLAVSMAGRGAVIGENRASGMGWGLPAAASRPSLLECAPARLASTQSRIQASQHSLRGPAPSGPNFATLETRMGPWGGLT